MVLVTEDIIDQQMEELANSSTAFEESLVALRREQPVIGGYLFTENHEVFTDAEREMLLFLTVVIWQAAAEAADGALPEVSGDQLAEAEEINWELLPTGKKMDFRAKLDPFFDNYPQEDLLALVEDSLTAEDEDEDAERLTEEGREALFISLKSIIDVLTLP